MAETTDDVRRDIELTRARMSTTLDQLEQKLNVVELVRDHPWPAIALALGAGVALSGSAADVKAATATVAATKGASSKLGDALDDVVAQLMAGLHGAIDQRIDGLVTEVKRAIGAPMDGQRTAGLSTTSPASTPAARDFSVGTGTVGTGDAIRAD